MSQVGKAIAAGLAGALVGGVDQYAKNKANKDTKNPPDKNPPDKTKTPDTTADKVSQAQKPLTDNSPSYSIAYKMRQDQGKTSDSQTPDIE